METQVFRDFDAFADSVGDVDARMTLCNARYRSWSISHVALSNIRVQLGRLGSGNIVEGESWSNGHLLYLPLTDTCAYSANGTLIRDNQFMVLEPGCDFCIATQAEHDWCAVFVPTELLTCGRECDDPSLASERTVCRVTPANRQIVDRFRAIIEQVLAVPAVCPQFSSSPAASCVESELLEIADAVIEQKQTDRPTHDGRPRIPRQEIVRRAQQFLEARRAEPVHVKEMALVAEASERTLRTAFKEYFGVGPTRYLQLRQLNQVQRALRAADADAVSVGDVLIEHGVWEFSRFASRYQQLFGELPSETLRRKST